MTLKELSQLYWLRREIEQHEARLEQLCASVGVSAQVYDGMPHAHSNSSPTERQAIRVADLRRTIESLRDRACEEERKLTEYIGAIPDAYLRVVFTCRFIDGMTWWQVANYIGNNMTADGVRKAVVRYLER